MWPSRLVMKLNSAKLNYISKPGIYIVRLGNAFAFPFFISYSLLDHCFKTQKNRNDRILMGRTPFLIT